MIRLLAGLLIGGGLGLVSGAVLPQRGRRVVLVGPLRSVAAALDPDDLVRAHPRECHCRGTGVVDPTVPAPRPCPVVWLPRAQVASARVGRLPRPRVR